MEFKLVKELKKRCRGEEGCFFFKREAGQRGEGGMSIEMEELDMGMHEMSEDIMRKINNSSTAILTKLQYLCML